MVKKKATVNRSYYSETPSSKKYIVPSVERSVQILEYLEQTIKGSTLGDISTQLDIPKSTAFRLLRTLTYYGYVEHDEQRGTFFLGSRILVLANSVRYRLDIVEKAIPHMERLTRETGETCKLGIMRNSELLVIHRIESLREMSARTDISARFPLHAGAASKLLLAHLPTEEIECYIRAGLQSFTHNTICDPVSLRRELDEIRRTGIAKDNEEFVEGIKAIACPIYDDRATVVAALSIPYLGIESNDQRYNELVSKLIPCALEISASLGYVPPTS